MNSPLAVPILSLLCATCATAPGRRPSDLGPQARALAQEVTEHGRCAGDLAELTSIGARPAGSSSAEAAVRWAVAKLQADGADRVWTQPVQVPRWIRGEVERAAMELRGRAVPLTVAALAFSPPTPAGGLRAQVVEVQGLDEVERLGDAVRGKLVFYDRRMDAHGDAFEAYGAAVDQRTMGALVAERHGAVGTLLRSLTTRDDDVPHVGVQRYSPAPAAIPAVALSAQAADALEAGLREEPGLTVTLELAGHRTLPWTTAENVVAERTGAELPGEIVVVSAHVDSWDLGVGAQDDGAGVVQAIEALRALRALDLRPRRTVRVVLYTGEELGGVGGREYARTARERGERHTVALESDRGGLPPVGFAIEGNPRALAALQAWRPYLEPLGAGAFRDGESGLDVEPLMPAGTVAAGLLTDGTRYFDFHHSRADQLAAVDPRALTRGAAAMAVFTYLAAEAGL